MKYEVVIGLEVHAQMLTDTKIFCGCSTRFGSGPNSQTCPVCTGQPGVLPVLNRKVVEFVIRTGLATGCAIAHLSRFARKNYFYPDLPKGYQISQFELPICEHGSITIDAGEGERVIGITRIHMEEDAGKNIHDPGGKHSFVDLNRTGVPLMEIVSEPDMRTPHEAGQYMRQMRNIVRALGVCDGNMEQGSLRCDANISLREHGATELGTKVEIKNLNSFRFVERALEYEIKRQTKVLDGGGSLVQETRLWDTGAGATQSMRSKEEAHDYRYFPDPDLVPIVVEQEWIDEIKATMPELPEARAKRLVSEMGIAPEDAALLCTESAQAGWFEEAVKNGADPRQAVNWIKGELARLLNEGDASIKDCALKPAALAGLLRLIDDGTISGKMAKGVFEEMYRTGKPAGDVVKEKGLLQISDEDELGRIVDDVIKNNPDEAERFRGGEQKLMGFFVGQIMKLTKGKANPKAVNSILKEKLKG